MTILDQFGRPIDIPRKPETRIVSVVSVSDRWSTYPSHGLTPEKLASILVEADQGDVYRQAELFEEMEEKDAHLSAELLKRKNAVNSLDFDILPYEEGARAVTTPKRGRPAKSDRVADFCRDVIFSMPAFEDALFDLLDAIGKGFAASWIKWEITEGKAVVRDLQWIHQKRLQFTDTLEPRLINEQGEGQEIGPFQVVYHRHRARSGYDTRAGLLRVCTWMYLFKNYAIKDWAAFCEVFGMPLRIGKYDPGASKDDKDALVTAIQALGSDSAGIISKATEIEFVEGVKNSSKDNVYKTLADFCNREISKAIVGATLTTDVGESGSYAASKTHNEVRLDLVKSDAWSLANTLRMQVLRPLVGFNFGWDTPVPWLQFCLQEPEDQKTLSEVYKNLVEMGQPIAAEHVSERFGIPLPEEGQTILAPPGRGPAAMNLPAPRASRQAGLIAAKSGQGSENEGPADTLLYALGKKTLSAAEFGGLMGPVERLLEASGSLEEFRDGLLGLYADMDESDLGDLMQRALTLAELSGRFDAKNE